MLRVVYDDDLLTARRLMQEELDSRPMWGHLVNHNVLQRNVSTVYSLRRTRAVNVITSSQEVL